MSDSDSQPQNDSAAGNISQDESQLMESENRIDEVPQINGAIDFAAEDETKDEAPGKTDTTHGCGAMNQADAIETEMSRDDEVASEPTEINGMMDSTGTGLCDNDQSTDQDAVSGQIITEQDNVQSQGETSEVLDHVVEQQIASSQLDVVDSNSGGMESTEDGGVTQGGEGSNIFEPESIVQAIEADTNPGLSSLEHVPDARLRTVPDQDAPVDDTADMRDNLRDAANAFVENNESMGNTTGEKGVQLTQTMDDDLQKIAKYDIIQVAGDDKSGQKVVIFSACNLPSSKDINHQQLLKYMRYYLNKHVESDYVAIYFHHGLSSQNNPSYKWLRQAYVELERKYKKNLKMLYVVHPTKLTRVLWLLMRPFISSKFRQKLKYIHRLDELKANFILEQLHIPDKVKSYDETLPGSGKKVEDTEERVESPPPPTQQFGVSLEFLKEHNDDIIPPVVKQCADYIRANLSGPDTEGIFRRSANATHLKEAQDRLNQGEQVSFDSIGGIHMATSLMKSFFRQLPVPLMTYTHYNGFTSILGFNEAFQIGSLKRLLHDDLPDDNYQLLKFVIQLLAEVASKSSENKMSAENLAIVFGPNLMWTQRAASFNSMTDVNRCVVLLIKHHEELFTKQQTEPQ